MTQIYNNFAEENTCDTYAETHDQPEPEVKQGKRVFTVQTRKINNKWVHEVVGFRSAK